jgi:hypothetical protein
VSERWEVRGASKRCEVRVGGERSKWEWRREGGVVEEVEAVDAACRRGHKLGCLVSMGMSPGSAPACKKLLRLARGSFNSGPGARNRTLAKNGLQQGSSCTLFLFATAMTGT